MLFTEERTRYIVVTANSAPYKAYAVIDIAGEFIEELEHSKKAADMLAEISDWYELTIHCQQNIVWLPEDVFDSLTTIAWEGYGNDTFAYAKISEDEMKEFVEKGYDPMNIEMCSLNLTSHNTFYFVTEAYNDRTEQRDRLVTAHVDLSAVLKQWPDEDDDEGLF